MLAFFKCNFQNPILTFSKTVDNYKLQVQARLVNSIHYSVWICQLRSTCILNFKLRTFDQLTIAKIAEKVY